MKSQWYFAVCLLLAFGFITQTGCSGGGNSLPMESTQSDLGDNPDNMELPPV